MSKNAGFAERQILQDVVHTVASRRTMIVPENRNDFRRDASSSGPSGYLLESLWYQQLLKGDLAEI